MCGIAGWASFDRDLAGHRDVLAAMTATMACRGPDDEGLFVDGPVALGHRRLAVLDPAGSTQPMTAHADGRPLATITFCGEVYNFAALRTELEGHGHRFHTRGDTEVVLHAYLRWGEDVAERLDGMFAFAVWDHRRRELLLVRDRMGVKPLYYHRTSDGVLFGSEPKAVLAHPAVRRTVDADGLSEALDMVKTPGHAVFSALAELRPGHTLRINAAGAVQRRYWALQAEEHTDDLDTTIATVRELLSAAVESQLVSDVPLCTLLSGGLDSSAITALAARHSTGRIRSFSVDFADAAAVFTPDAVRGGADAPFAREVAAYVGAEHHEVLLDSAELTDPAVRHAVLGAVDLPPAYWGDMWPSLYLLSRAIRKHATVALSGESADELFGGYRWFHNPNAIGADTFPWLTSGSARYFGGTSLLDRGLVAKLDLPSRREGAYRDALAEVPRLAGESGTARRMRELSYLNLTRFVQTLLDRKDRMSMAAGLEVRVPFCDHRLVQYVFSVPWAWKSFDGREKSLLRAAVADLLPRSVLERPKTPYPATLDVGYEKALREELARVDADPDAPVRPLLDRERVRALLARPLREQSRSYDRGGLEMALWLNSWLDRYRIRLDL
ncbi:asparagine synthase (glutamine-hydrolyzing) [Amycolatopsis orientalis]|uniref:asparagine synthase (glutamine-hydrolyzing) n=1 Tax=Amycolatopsis orientalis TaxID=31958 RepID=A0A193C729_AMYOR|nr:asparagine synthase (glutamine-hydrolyzing) [Amycolatopsis orientalis]ANN20163.1 asparagine synthase (glutamine-hydrolyzing) [Amycolatopsis orientalis]